MRPAGKRGKSDQAGKQAGVQDQGRALDGDVGARSAVCEFSTCQDAFSKACLASVVEQGCW